MNSEDKKLIQRLKDLKKQREQLLSLQPADILERLPETPRALEIVHSIPSQDLHILIRDMGAQDALPILSLASNQQWEYILDTEIWNKDRLDPVASTKWLHMLLAADPQRLASWCSHEKAIFTELFLYQNVQIRIREHDQSPSEFGDGFVTFDDTIYFRILDPAPEPSAAANTDESDHQEKYTKDRQTFLIQLLQRLADIDHRRFQSLLLESAALIPAETEEEAYRMRNVRLAAKGFLPFEEAVGIYQPQNPANLSQRPKALVSDPPETEALEPIPFLASHLLAPDNLFAQALESIGDIQVLMPLQSEFAGLCNQLVVADQSTLTGRAGLQTTVRKAAGYLSIGLQSIAENYDQALQKFLLSDIFRIGYGQALRLKWRADNWHRDSWCLSQGLPLSFWDEKGMGLVGGLLIKRPLFFDDYQSGTLYREFEKMADIESTDMILKDIINLDGLLAELGFKLKPYPATGLLSYKNLLLTHWARAALDLSTDDNALTPVPLDHFKSFFETIWRTKTKPRRIRMAVKSDFLKWLAQKSGRSANDITDRNGRILEDLFAEIEQELGELSSENLDPRFTNLFFVK